MKSWKTTIGGCLVAVGTVVVQISSPAWVPVVGTALVAIGSVFMGTSARDNKVTSEEVNKK